MPKSKVDIEISTLIRARYPIVYVVSWEEHRVEDALRRIANPGKKVYTWSITQGVQPSPSYGGQALTILAALEFVEKCDESAVFIFKDMHSAIADSIVIRRLRDLVSSLKSSRKTIVMLSPVLRLPPELEKDIAVVDYNLPLYDELGELLDVIIDKMTRDGADVNVNLKSDEREKVIKAAQGLTLTEAENVFARSLVEKRAFDVGVILKEKEQIVRKSGLLEYYPAEEKFSDVGGLDILKDWLAKRGSSFTQRARDYGLPEPKGILLLGVQGCGKSLSAKAVGSLWNLPILRLDVGKIFSGIVGSSEQNVRRAIQVAESVAPVVLWMDEMEKGFAGVQSSPLSDAGTTSRVFGTFITWLQEKTAPVFVVATANDISQLPPELLRKGRFDEIFFVDLPSEAERGDIFRIHLAKRKRDPNAYDIDSLAAESAGFSGAEIEQAVVSALFDAFPDSREVSNDDILNAVRSAVPISVTMAEQIAYIRDWAQKRARAAS
ncbi:MAG: AAA family ATPase [Armatimonadota bacterium]|nr:AAA family ATPase [bacterium]